MRTILILLVVLAACNREASRPSAPIAAPAPAPTAASDAGARGDYAAATAAYKAKQFARCAELFASLGEGGGPSADGHFYDAACCYALAGNPDRAFTMLDRSLQNGFHEDAHMASDTDLESLHADPRWTRALQAVSAARKVEEGAITEPALRDELLALEKEDQAARNAWIESSFKDPAAEARVRDSDRKTTARLKQVIAKHGWPGKTLVGKRAAHAAWLLVQHADADRAFQKQCLALIEKGADAGEATKSEYAYLYDRVAVAENRPQRYGTQYNGDKPAPIEDEAHVDERRKAVGLGTMAEYDQQMRAAYGNNLGGK